MVTMLLLAVFIGTTITIVMVIYLIDRMNALEKITMLASSNANKKTDNADNVFLGLTGKRLWDAMCGKAPKGFNDNDLIALKSRYKHVLQKHIETLFFQGLKDSQQGNPAKKPNQIETLKTLRGTVESWIPPQHAASIYNIGFESNSALEEETQRLLTSLDETVDILFSRTDITLERPLSERLFTPEAAASDEQIQLDGNLLTDQSRLDDPKLRS